MTNYREAKAAGYRALTMRYFLPKEQWMLDAVVADMKRAGVNHVLVKERGGVSVWRSAPGGNPSPLPLSPSDVARGSSLGKETRAALPGAATLLNPAGVRKLARRASRTTTRRTVRRSYRTTVRTVARRVAA